MEATPYHRMYQLWYRHGGALFVIARFYCNILRVCCAVAFAFNPRLLMPRVVYVALRLVQRRFLVLAYPQLIYPKGS
jgi:hypothetical protein